MADTNAIIKATKHPGRRKLLRELIASDEPLSPKDLADVFDAPLSNVSYHVRVLSETGAIELVDTKPRRGSTQHFYSPSEMCDDELLKMLIRADRGIGPD